MSPVNNPAKAYYRVPVSWRAQATWWNMRLTERIEEVLGKVLQRATKARVSSPINKPPCACPWRVCVPGLSPFSQLILHETDKSNVVRLKGQTNERINRTNSKTITPPRSSESKTRGPFRSQVIDGALEEEEDRRRAVMFEIPVTRARIRS